MNSIRYDQDDRFLDDCIKSVREEYSATEMQSATARFRAMLPDRAVSTGGRFMRWAGGAVAAALLITLVPQIMPGNGGVAFARVQSWFEDFRTVHTTTVTTQGDRELSRIETWATADGSMRLESGPVVQIFDASAGTMHTLLPGDRVMSMPVPMDEAAAPAASMEWVQEIRDFQGQAQRLPETRRIDGQEAVGFRLMIDGITVDLWAQPETGRPILMELMMANDVTMRTRLAFDQALPTDVFTVPSHYQPVDSEE